MRTQLVTIVAVLGVGVLVASAAFAAHRLAIAWRLDAAGEDRLIDACMTVAAFAGAAALVALGRRLPSRPAPTTDAHAVATRAFEAERRARNAALRAFLAADARLAKYVPLLDAGHVFDRAAIERREARVRELEAAGARPEYVARVVRGEHVTDEMIAYWDDPTRTVTCAHLRDCEADLRRTDPYVTPNGNGVTCRLHLDLAALRARYGWPADVTFWEEEDRPGHVGDLYQGVQRISCTCPSWIEGTTFGTPFPATR